VECRFERSLIHHLCKYPKDFAGAWRKMPKNLRFMFTHAFQSFLFNQVIEERLKQGFGLEAVECDILEDNLPTGPLYGFESKLASGKPGEIEKKVLAKEGFGLSDFKIKVIPELSSKGMRKKIVLFPQDLKLLGIAPDEFNEGKLKATVSFALEKGAYATVVLKELTKSTE
jgi:tRNA pseudouridine13 synthase